MSSEGDAPKQYEWLRIALASKRDLTVGEVKKLQAKDPEWIRDQQAREAAHQASVDELAREIEPENGPLNCDLAEVGWKVESMWDLVNTTASYPRALPVLLKHLPLVRHPVMREGIARALSVIEARGLAGPEILTQLEQGDDPEEVRWAFANALTTVAVRADANRIKALLDNGRYEDCRDRLYPAFKKAMRRSGEAPAQRPGAALKSGRDVPSAAWLTRLVRRIMSGAR